MDKNTERRNTRRIVSTGVEEEGGALRSVIDILEHGVEVENGSVGIQVAVVLGGNTSIVEDAVVVAPSRLREIDGLGDVLVNEELGEKTERAGTGNGLANGDSVLSEGLAVLSEHELGGSLVEGGVSIESGVLVIVLAADSSFSLSHGREDPGLSIVVTIGTDTENDLVGVLIGHELFLKKENGIGNRIFGISPRGEGERASDVLGRANGEGSGES